MTKKSMKLLLMLVITGLLLIGCANDNGEDNGNRDANGNYEVQILQFVATVLEIDENSILVESVEGEDILKSGDQVSVITGALDPEAQGTKHRGTVLLCMLIAFLSHRNKPPSICLSDVWIALFS